MSLALHLSSLPPFLLLALLSSLIGKTNGIPLSADNAIIHAVQPACTTLQGDSTSCNVGINTVPSLVTLDGGYEWLTIQPTTITESGSTLKTNEAVWTAVQTSYLDVEPITTTATDGAISVSTSTAYVSFITTTTAAAGAAPTALIAAAVIAPELVGTLQPIIDSASGKTAEAIGSEMGRDDSTPVRGASYEPVSEEAEPRLSHDSESYILDAYSTRFIEHDRQ